MITLNIQPKILIYGITLFTVCVTLQNCNNPNPQVKSAGEIQDSIRNADSLNALYLQDMEAYKKEMEDTIAAIDQRIDEFQEQTGNVGSETQPEYKKAKEDLKERGKELKNKLADYKEKGKEKWQEFKQGFNRDMDSLSSKVKELTSKKKKS